MNQQYGIAVDPEQAASRANVLMESEIKARIDAVRQLAQRQNGLDAAVAEYETAYQAATRAGWSEDKLRDIGLRSPESVSAGAGRRSAPGEQAPTMASVVQLPAPASFTPAQAPAPAQASGPAQSSGPAQAQGPIAVPSFAASHTTTTS